MLGTSPIDQNRVETDGGAFDGGTDSFERDFTVYGPFLSQYMLFNRLGEVISQYSPQPSQEFPLGITSKLRKVPVCFHKGFLNDVGRADASLELGIDLS